jgi:hypothetical protein
MFPTGFSSKKEKERNKLPVLKMEQITACELKKMVSGII